MSLGIYLIQYNYKAEQVLAKISVGSGECGIVMLYDFEAFFGDCIYVAFLV